MASNDAKVKVRLDTKEAKGELRGLVREAEASAGKVAGNVRGAISKGFGFVGAGAALGTGLAAVKGATHSGVGDVMGEAFGGVGAQIAEFFLGDLDDKSRAARSAREETIQAFGTVAGASNRVPPGAKKFFDQVHALRLQEEKGRGIFERNERFQGPGVGDMVDRIMAGFGELISRGVQELKDALNPFK